MAQSLWFLGKKEISISSTFSALRMFLKTVVWLNLKQLLTIKYQAFYGHLKDKFLSEGRCCQCRKSRSCWNSMEISNCGSNLSQIYQGKVWWRRFATETSFTGCTGRESFRGFSDPGIGTNYRNRPSTRTTFTRRFVLPDAYWRFAYRKMPTILPISWHRAAMCPNPRVCCYWRIAVEHPCDDVCCGVMALQNRKLFSEKICRRNQ